MVILCTFVEPESPIHLVQRDTRVILDKKELGKGTLYISERSLAWKTEEIGLTLSYPSISLHAISNDVSLHPTECIYVMVASRIQIPGVTLEVETNSEDGSESSESDISELILVPEDLTAIKPMYDALKECQSLNPDPLDMEGDEDIYEDADEDFIAEDFGGGGGDNGEMDNLADDLSNRIEINYDQNNGDNINEDMFEDAD